MDQASDVQPTLSSSARQELLARSKRARAEARELIDKCVRTSASYELQQQRYAAMKTALAELRTGLHGLVTAYSHGLRQLEVPPEHAIILVKELVDDPTRLLPADDLAELRSQLVTWAVEAYYAA